MSALAKRIPRWGTKATFLACDIQERFRPLITHFSDVVHTATTLCKAAELFDQKVYFTEQYPKAFLHTVHELKPYIKPNHLSAKSEFSMFSTVKNAMNADLCEQIVLFGIEAHVCVQHTAFDFLSQGHDVILVVDGISSQRLGDRAIALHELSKAGATLTTTENFLLGAIKGADHPLFKGVSNLLKEHNKGPSNLATLA